MACHRPICIKSIFGRGSAPDPAGRAYDVPQTPNRMVKGHPSPRFLPLGALLSARTEIVIGPRENVSRAPLWLSTGLPFGGPVPTLLPFPFPLFLIPAPFPFLLLPFAPFPPRSGHAPPHSFSLLPPLLFPFRPSISLRSQTHYIQLEGLGSAVSSPAGSGAEPQPKSNLVHFSFKI